MDKVKTAVKCAGVGAAYLLLLMFSKLLEFWIFTSKLTYEELLNQTWNWEAMPESFLFTFPYRPGATDYTAAVSADPWQRFPDSKRKICITTSQDACGNFSFTGSYTHWGGHRSLLCKTGYSLVDAAF